MQEMMLRKIQYFLFEAGALTAIHTDRRGIDQFMIFIEGLFCASMDSGDW